MIDIQSLLPVENWLAPIISCVSLYLQSAIRDSWPWFLWYLNPSNKFDINIIHVIIIDHHFEIGIWHVLYKFVSMIEYWIIQTLCIVTSSKFVLYDDSFSLIVLCSWMFASIFIWYRYHASIILLVTWSPYKRLIVRFMIVFTHKLN